MRTILLPVIFVVLGLTPGAFAGAPDAAGPYDTVPLTELWRIGADEDDPNQLFGLITDVCVDEAGNIHIVDQQLAQVSVFGPDGQFVRRIGREGDGPGEFRRPYRVFLSPSGEVCVLSSRIGMVHRFHREGEHLGEYVIPPDENEVVPVFREIKRSDDRIVTHSLIRKNSHLVLPGERAEVRAIQAFTSEFELVRCYHDETFLGDDARPVWSERPNGLERRWDVGPDGTIHVATDFLDYTVTAFGPDGEVRGMLTRDYPRRKRSGDEKQAVYDWATLNPHGNLPGTKFEIEDHDKDIMSLHCRDDGSVWVLTSRGFHDRPDGSLGVFDVFGADGEFARRVSLAGDADPARDRYFFHGDRLYVVTCFTAVIAQLVSGGAENRFSDGCDEPMEIVCYRIGRD